MKEIREEGKEAELEDGMRGLWLVPMRQREEQTRERKMADGKIAKMGETERYRGGGWLNEEGRGNQGVRKDNKRRVFLPRLLNGRKLEVPNGRVSGSQTSDVRKWKVQEIAMGGA